MAIKFNTLIIANLLTILLSSCAGTTSESMSVSASSSDLPPTVSKTGCDVVLEWSAPKFNTKSEAITNIAGYKIYYDTQPGVYKLKKTITGSQSLSIVITELENTVYYFSITAFNTVGIDSDYSDEYFFSCVQ